MKTNKISLTLALGLALLSAGSASTQSAYANEMAYDRQLIRLAEVLGSLHYLRALCGEQNNMWRERMEKLLDAEKPDEERRLRIVASFNHGYSSFAAVYTTCTKSAVAAIDRYMQEGEKITVEIVQRYGN